MQEKEAIRKTSDVAKSAEKVIDTLKQMSVRTNVVVLSEEWMTKIKAKAIEEQRSFDGYEGAYNHNKVKSIMSGLMGEVAIRNTYRYYGTQARMNLHYSQPDLTIPATTNLNGVVAETHEEVKSWQLCHYARFGNTVRVEHAKKYVAKDRKRVWFVSCDVENRTVVIRGWLHPLEIMENEIIMTDGKYGGENYNCEVLHRASEVFPKMEEVDVDGAWW